MSTESSTMPLPAEAVPAKAPAPATASSSEVGLYRRLWRAFPRDFGYLALTGVLVAVAYLAWGVVGLFGGAGFDPLGTVVLAAVLLVIGLYFGRLFGRIELVRLGWAHEPAPRPVRWRQIGSTNRLVRLVEVAADPHYWLYFLFTVIVFPVVGTVVVGVVAGVIAVGLGAIVGGIVFASLHLSVGSDLWYSAMNYRDVYDSRVLYGLLAVVIGLVLLAVVPFLSRAAVFVSAAVAAPLLGGFRSDELSAAVAGLQVSRSAAVSAEGTALRRLERDIHDGPQQRLIRLQMDLGAAARAAGTDADKSKGLIEDALVQAREALEELRALSRGFAPPLLLDRGLAPALAAVVDRSTIPMRFTDELPTGAVIPVEIERNAYFIAAELLANVSKHSGADRAELVLSAPTRGSEVELRIVVTDDGHGGAVAKAGHGLAGIEQRLVGLGGRFDLRSPVGGPTHASIRIPVGVTEPSVDENTPTLAYPTEELPSAEPRDGMTP